jgi:uncharacterized cupin superfamily protein
MPRDRDDVADTIRRIVSHAIVQSGDLPFTERPYRPQDEPRHVASLTEALGLESSRASLWRYPPGTRGRRHREGAQEEVFACLEGAITLALGEPPEMVELRAGGFARVSTGTEIQVRNESGADAVVLAWGAPAVTGQAEILNDLP